MTNGSSCRPRTVLLLLFLFLSASALAPAQPLFYVYDVDPSQFPLVSAKFIALDRTMRHAAGLQPGDFDILEGGATRQVVDVTCPDFKSIPLSCVLTIDVSSSMSEMKDGETNMDVAKAAALTWVNTMPMNGSECAVTSFDEQNYLNIGFTEDRPSLYAAITGLKPQGGTSYDAGFLTPPGGALGVAAEGKNKRIIVFLTDGQAAGNEDSIVAVARRHNVTIYCVTLRTTTPPILRNVATRTGGRWFGEVTTRQDIERIYQIILQLAQNTGSCRLTWKSAPGCATGRDAVITFTRESIFSPVPYFAPDNSTPGLSIDAPMISLGAVPPSTTRDTTITITARSTPLRITRAASSNPYVIVDEGIVGSVLEPGESRRITIRYAPVDSALNFARVEFQTEPILCDESYVYLWGGFPGHYRAAQAPAITKPNGGERFAAGQRTTLEWTGVMPEDTVTIEYSVDGGGSWEKITDAAIGLSHEWKVPNFASERCLARVSGPRRSEMAQTLRGGVGPITGAAASPDGVRILICGVNSGGELWDGTHGRFLKRALERRSPIHAAAFDPDGKRIVAAGNGSEAKIWDANGDAVMTILKGHRGTVIAASFSPDGERVATGGADSVVKLWSARSGACLTTVSPRSGECRSVLFSPNGTRLAAIVGNARIDIVGSSNGAQVASIKQLSNPSLRFTSIAFSPDGKYILTGASDSTARLWDAGSGAPVRTYKGHNGEVMAVAFSRDGKWVATGSSDGTARIWNAATATTLRVMPEHNGEVSTVMFMPYDNRLVTGSRDGAIRIWYSDASASAPDPSDSLWMIIMPRLQLVTGVVDFGRVQVGTERDTTIPVMVRNPGKQPVDVTSVAVRGVDADQFVILDGDKPFTLVPGGVRTMRLRFAPTAIGKARAQIEFEDASSPLAVSDLLGEGVSAPEPSIEIQSAITYPPISCRETFTDILLEIRNSGAADLNVTKVEMAGANPEDFSIFPRFSPLNIPAGEAAKLVVRFAPLGQGLRYGLLLLHSNAANEEIQTIALQGRKENVAFASSVGVVEFGTLCPGKEGITTFTIQNVGSIGGRVYASITGPFVLDETSWHVGVGEAQMLTVRLPKGTGEGEITGAIEIIDSICGNTLTIPVRSMVLPTTLSAAPAGMISVDGEPVEGDVVLTNTSQRDLVVTEASSSDGRFTITDPPLPLAIPAGESRTMTVLYTPAGDDAIGGTLELRGRPCDLAVTVPLSGSKRATQIVEIPTIEGAPGDRIAAPIRLAKPGVSLFTTSAARTFSATIRFDASLLAPAPGAPSGIVRNGERIITIDGVWDGISTELAKLDLIATLGPTDSTAIVIDDFVWTNEAARPSTRDGLFRLTGICREGGARLLSTRAGVALKESYPNPSGGTTTIEFTTIEQGWTRLVVVDKLGRPVATLAEGNIPPGAHTVVVDVSTLASGVYFCLLETPTGRLSRRMEVRK